MLRVKMSSEYVLEEHLPARCCEEFFQLLDGIFRSLKKDGSRLIAIAVIEERLITILKLLLCVSKFLKNI